MELNKTHVCRGVVVVVYLWILLGPSNDKPGSVEGTTT